VAEKGGKFRVGHVEIQPAGIGGHPPPPAAKVIGQGHAGALRGKIPQGDLDRLREPMRRVAPVSTARAVNPVDKGGRDCALKSGPDMGGKGCRQRGQWVKRIKQRPGKAKAGAPGLIGQFQRHGVLHRKAHLTVADIAVPAILEPGQTEL